MEQFITKMYKGVKQNSMENKGHPRSARITSSAQYRLNHKESKFA
jgi:hypothetical protein